MKKLLIAACSILVLNVAWSQQELRKKHFNLEKGIAIQGYDPVAYFKSNKAIKGSKQFAVFIEGVTYYFSTAENKEVFLKSPKSYEPQYGGWCAYAMGATNEKVEVDPETFKIKDGKLFLFYHSWVNNTLTKWNKDEANLHSKAEANWKIIYH
jgi:YHS domain-containing protein